MGRLDDVRAKLREKAGEFPTTLASDGSPGQVTRQESQAKAATGGEYLRLLSPRAGATEHLFLVAAPDCFAMHWDASHGRGRSRLCLDVAGVGDCGYCAKGLGTQDRWYAGFVQVWQSSTQGWRNVLGMVPVEFVLGEREHLVPGRKVLVQGPSQGRPTYWRIDRDAPLKDVSALAFDLVGAILRVTETATKLVAEKQATLPFRKAQ